MNRDCLPTHAYFVEQVGSYFEDKGDNDELFLQEKYEDGFSKFWEKISIEEQTISWNQIEKMEHNCENACMNDESLFLDELFKDECDYSDEKSCVDNLKSIVPFE